MGFFLDGSFVCVLVLVATTLPPIITAGNILTGCVTDYQPGTDYFPDKDTSTVPDDFTITYYLNYKVVVNVYTNETFALYQCGTPKPTGLHSYVKVFPVPFKSVALTDTVQVAFFEMLGVRTSIEYIGQEDIPYVTSPCVQAMIADNRSLALSDNTTTRQRQLDSVQGCFVDNADPAEPKYISFSASEDPGAIRRPEWIYFVAAFYNRELEATNIMNGILSRYQCVSQVADAVPGSPLVAWVSYDSYSALPFFIDNAQYKMDFVKNLGGLPLNLSVTSFNTTAQWKAQMVDVDIVIDETYEGNYTSFLQNFDLEGEVSTSPFKFLRQHAIWRFDRLQNINGGLDWFEGAIPNAAAVLEDLLTIFKPNSNFNHSRIWFRNSYLDQPIFILNASQCANYNETLPPSANNCTYQKGGGSEIRPKVWLISLFVAMVLVMAFPW